ncbi:BRCT domain-containing protein [Pannus brasiliensis CCIBt3594]|uniref:BRCT domain-containing protein n=1 Tax=Pannus brasiliensis CCIBt3594 TaxID=1427578 RepID=A0AAW9QKP6_9CHRO
MPKAKKQPENEAKEAKTEEFNKKDILDLAAEQCKYFMESLESGDIVRGNEILKTLKVLLDAGINEIDKTELFDRVSIEHVGKLFCLTGDFSFGSRRDSEAAVTNSGGVLEKNVTTRLDYLIVGTKDNPDWKHANFGRKIEKAIELREKTGKPLIISESDWIESIKSEGR